MTENYIDCLRQILEFTSWTQVQLAEQLGVTHAALNRWLNNKATPQKSHLLHIQQRYKDIVGIHPLPKEQITQLLRGVGHYKIQNVYTIMDTSHALKDDLLLELTYNSNTIEGATFTKKETEAVIFDHSTISNKSLEEHLAAVNHAQALSDIFAGRYKGCFTEKKIKKLHKTVMQGIRPDAGEYATLKRGIRGVNLALPHPEDIPEEMGLLVGSISLNKDKHPIEYIAQFHADFEAIHPFGDGNGRVGRLIMAGQLLDEGYPPALIENKRKADYYEVLEFAQKKSLTHLVRFLVEEIQESYKIFQKYL